MRWIGAVAGRAWCHARIRLEATTRRDPPASTTYSTFPADVQL